MTVTFGPNVTMIPAYMFYTSSSYAGQEPKLTAVRCDGAEIEHVGAFAFYRCADLTSVELGDAVRYIEDGAFNSCSALASVTLPMDLESIGDKAFFRTGLQKIDLGKEIYFIGENAFGECAEGFTIYGFPNSYAQYYAEENNIPFAPLGNIGTMLLHDNHSYSDCSQTVEGLIGDTVNLYSYSKAAQARYFEFASSANLVAWNTMADGSGIGYAIDGEAVMEEELNLYGQWETMQLVVDGNAYPVDRKISGDGWSYNGQDLLTLIDYDGGEIVLPRGFYIETSGDVVIDGGIHGTEDLHIKVCDGTLTITGTEAVITSDDVELTAHGAVSISTGGKIAIEANGIRLTGDGEIEISAKSKALSYRRLSIDERYKLYLSADAVDPAYAYRGGKYIRLEENVWQMALHANGGSWSDQSGQRKDIEMPGGQSVYLGDYADLLSREGHMLEGWCDLEDDQEYTVRGYASTADLVLYAKWIEQALIIDGTSYSVKKAQSGTGWSFTPAVGRNTAALAITEGYNGGPIVCTEDLILNIDTSVIFTGRTTKPAIKVYGELELIVGEGNTVSIYGGSGESAISAEHALIYNYGDLSIYGGSGGSGVDCDAALCSDGDLSIVGGLRSPAIDGSLHLENSKGTIVLVAGANAYEAFSGGWGHSGDLAMKFYVGEHASDAVRSERPWGKYVRIQPRTVILMLDANGGTIDGAFVETVEVTQAADNTILLPAETTPVMEGYTFAGWNTEADGSGETYVEGAAYRTAANAERVVLYAQWIEAEALSVEILSHQADSMVVRVWADHEKTKAAQVYIAVYDGEDRMLAVKAVTVGEIAADGSEYTLSYTGKAARAKMFALDGGFVPVGQVIEPDLK